MEENIKEYIKKLNNDHIEKVNSKENELEKEMEQISNIHTGYIHKLITNVSRYFFEMTWQFEISVIPLIIGGTSIFIMICKESFLTGLICIVISALAVFTKYKMIRNMQKYQKKANEASSKYNAKFIDFIQNIIAVRKLNIGEFCEDKITENSNEYLNEYFSWIISFARWKIVNR